MLTLSLLTLAVSPIQSGDLPENLVQLLASEYQALAGLPPVPYIRQLYPPQTGRGGGWVAVASGDNGSGTVRWASLIGQRPSGIDGPIEVLRVPRTIQGFAQQALIRPSMANGQIAYLESTSNFGLGWGRGVWLEDQRIASAGDTIPGADQWTWTHFEQVELSTSGTLIVMGEAQSPTSNHVARLIWEWPSETVLLRERQQLDGFQSEIKRFVSRAYISPDGEHWSIVVSEESSFRDALVLDGEILEVGDGQLVIEDEPVPAELAGSPGLVWDNFYGRTPYVNNAGDVAFSGRCTNRDGSGGFHLHVRNGRRFASPFDGARIEGIDPDGALIRRHFNNPMLYEYEGRQLLPSDLDLDVDGDGVADSNFEVSASSAALLGLPDNQSITLKYTLTRQGNGLWRESIVRGRDFRIHRPACEGHVNSTGFPAKLVATGSAVASWNDVSLAVLGLPAGSTGYVLLSRTFGVVSQPGGSQGDLCLSGAIGRLRNQVFVAQEEGRAAVELDLAAIPQPTGAVSAIAGDVWFAQAWYRDAAGGTATSNFSSAAAVILR